MWIKVFLVLATLFIAEIICMIKLGGYIGTLGVIGAIVLTAVLGYQLVKSQGIRFITKIQSEIMAGKPLGDSILNGLALLMAGILLITPGFIADSLGLFLLIPPVRKIIINFAYFRFKKKLIRGMGGFSMGQGATYYGGNSFGQKPAHDPNQIDASWKVESESGETKIIRS